MNEALNTLMSMVENGTDLYTAFQNYFTTQKGLFEDTADATQEDFTAYVEGWKLRVTALSRQSRRTTARRSLILKLSRNSYSTLGLSL